MSQNILLMDDDPAAYLVYERIVRDRFGPDITIDHCIDENHLTEVLSAKHYSIIILDQRLRNGTLGLELVPLIRKLSPGTRIVLNSAFGDEELAVEAINAGVDAYVLGRKQDDGELLRVLGKELDGLRRLSILTSRMSEETNGDIRATCDELTSSLRRKVDGIRRGRDDSI